jgi:hypothetical protein
MSDLATIGFRADTTGIRQAEKGLDDLAKQGGKTERSLESASGGMAKAFTVVAGAVATAATALSSLNKIVAVTREFDVLNAGLITATGSAENATHAFKAIQDFATSTPYSLAQATKAFNQLVNMGLTPSEKALTSYGNTAAAMGKDLSQMVEAVADAATGEFERLKEFGIKSSAQGDRVAFTFRGITTTVGNSAAEIEKYLMGLGNNEFAGAMANRMATLDGAISNLSDSWDALFLTVSKQGAGSVIESSVRMATDAIGNLTDSLASGQMQGYLDAIASKFTNFGAGVASILDNIGGLFADAGKYWSLDMSETARLIVQAFRDMPENIKAFLQVVTIEVAAYVDRMVVYGKMAAEALNPFSNGFDPTAEFAAINQARQASLQAIMNERQASIDSFTSQITAADQLRKAYDENASAIDKNVDRLEQYGKTAAKVGKIGVASFKNMEEAAQDHFDALEELEEIEKDRISRKESEIEAALEWEEATTKGVETVATLSEKAAERIESAFADAWMNAFDGMNSVVDGMKNAFKRMLAEMAHEAFTKQIMVNMGFTGGGAAGTAGGAGGMLGSLGSIFGGASGGAAGAGGLGSMFGSSLLSSLGPAMAMIAAGSAISKALGGTGNLLRGGIVGDVLLGSWKNERDTLGLGVSGGDVTGSQTTTNVKKKFFKNRRETFTSDYDASSLDSAFDMISKTLSEAAKTFGITTADEVIKGFSSAINIDLKGKTQEQIDAAIGEWFASTADALTSAIFGDSLSGLQKEGESVVNTVSRLSANMATVSAISKTLGLGFDLTGKSAMIAATNIVELAGGLDQLTALSSQYYQSFYSETEKQVKMQQQLAEEFAKLNTTAPATRDQFRAMVDGLDLTTAAGQAQFAALMQLVPTMDSYLSAIEAQTDAAQRAAEAATKEAEAKAAALKASQSSLELRLMDALGESSAALAVRRQMELDATDASLRGLLQSIFAAEDAALAQRELAAAQNTAADAARNAAAAAKDAASNAFNKLQEAAGREKDRIKSELDLKLESIDKERGALEQQRDSVINGYNEQSQAVQQYVSRLEGLNGVISGFLAETGAAVDPFKRLSQIFSEVKTGLLPDQSELQSVLSGINSAGSGGFGSAFEQQRAMAIARNQAASIGGAVNGQISGAKSQLQLIQQQVTEAGVYYDEQLAKLDTAAEQAQKLHDEQVGRIDKQLSEAEKQYNALMGIDDRILTMEQALTEFNTALAAAGEVSLAVEIQQVEAINRVEAAVVGLGVQLIEMNRPEDRIWLPPSLPPTLVNEGEPVTREMVDLLKEILSAQESTAKHTKTTADVVQLNQFEAQEAVL